PAQVPLRGPAPGRLREERAQQRSPRIGNGGADHKRAAMARQRPCRLPPGRAGERMLRPSCPTRRVPSTGGRPMKAMKAGVTKAGKGIDNIVWNILGQTYTPKQVSESSFSWHALFPPGTFVPPHIHANQDEFIYVLEGRFDLFLDGKDASATAG